MATPAYVRGSESVDVARPGIEARVGRQCFAGEWLDRANRRIDTRIPLTLPDLPANGDIGLATNAGVATPAYDG